MKILLVEDDEQTSNFLSATLSAHRYAVDIVADGAAGMDMASRWDYDLILLDVILPTLNGTEVCRRLRSHDPQTPILILTTQDSDEDVIAGLDAGADDYVSKSCTSSQLLARVRALLRRSSTIPLTPVLTWGELCLDPTIARVTYAQTVVPLRPREYSLLELFLRNPQRLLSRRAIIDHLWPIEETPVEGSITNLIKDLRQRLKASGMESDLIETVYGLGYRLKTSPTSPQSVAKQSSVDCPGQEAVNLVTSINEEGQPEDWCIRQQRGTVRIQAIVNRFQTSLAKRLQTLQALEQSFQVGELSAQQRHDAKTEIHKLAGGLGTFGYTKASKIAQAMEQLMETHTKQEQDCIRQFSQLLEQLQQELTIAASSFDTQVKH